LTEKSPQDLPRTDIGSMGGKGLTCTTRLLADPK
jgi:hypothetical protein